MTDLADDVRRLCPRWEVQGAEPLRSSNRAVVQRLAILDEEGKHRTVIAKRPVKPGEAAARELAALAILPAGARAPRLLAGQPDPPVMVMTDLGSGPNVADALLSDDAVEAEDAVLAWATALARFHAGTLDLGSAFSEELGRWASGTTVVADDMPLAITGAATALQERADRLGVLMPQGFHDDLHVVIERLSDPTCAALSPGDTCPDNNRRDEDGQVSLLDFEAASFRHIAWDVSYLRVPWATCWCSWQLPDRVGLKAIERYRAELRPTLPWASTKEFTVTIDLATIGWAIMSTQWFLPKALAGDPPPSDPTLPIPRRKPLLLQRLADGTELARRHGLNDLSEGLSHWLRHLHELWGPSPLALAPAFRS